MLRLRVKEVAQNKGVGLARLSRLADISYKTVQKLWHNPYHDASISTLNRIARALNVPGSSLVEDIPEDQVPEKYRLPPIRISD